MPWLIQTIRPYPVIKPNPANLIQIPLYAHTFPNPSKQHELFLLFELSDSHNNDNTVQSRAIPTRDYAGLNNVHLKIHVHLEPQNMTLFGSRGFQIYLVKMRLHWIRVGPIPMIPHKKKHRDTEVRQPCEDREWTMYTATSQGPPWTASDNQKLEKVGKHFSLQPLE